MRPAADALAFMFLYRLRAAGDARRWTAHLIRGRGVRKAIISITASALLLVALPSARAQDESPVAVRVERVIKNREPHWRYIRGVQSGRVPGAPGEKILVTSLWERRRKGGKREAVSVNIYEASSASEAGNRLRPMSAGETAPRWRVEKYPIADEAYISKYQNGRRYALHFRKDEIVVEVSGESLDSVKRFAQYVLSGITAD